MTIDETIAFVNAIAEMGVSAEEAGQALRQMSQVLADVNFAKNSIYDINNNVGKLQTRTDNVEINNNICHNEITDIKDTIADLRYLIECTNGTSSCLQDQFDDLRSELDALIEKSKQETVLEKIEPIVEIKRKPIFDTKELDEWYDNFIKEFKIIS